MRPRNFTPCKVGIGKWSYVKIFALDSAKPQALIVEAWSQLVPKKISRTFSAAASQTPKARAGTW